jgi:hypothetical protein
MITAMSARPAPANHDFEGGPRRSLKDIFASHRNTYRATKRAARDVKYNWSISRADGNDTQRIGEEIRGWGPPALQPVSNILIKHTACARP